MNLPMAAVGLILTLGVQVVNSCSYTAFGYDRCNGIQCNYDYQCTSTNCVIGYC